MVMTNLDSDYVTRKYIVMYQNILLIFDLKKKGRKGHKQSQDKTKLVKHNNVNHPQKKQK